MVFVDLGRGMPEGQLALLKSKQAVAADVCCLGFSLIYFCIVVSSCELIGCASVDYIQKKAPS